MRNTFGGERRFFLYLLPAIAVFVYFNGRSITDPSWLPVHDTLVQFTEFLYTVSAYQNGELPLWNSYLYGGQPFYLLLNHGQLLNPIMWIWIAAGTLVNLPHKDIFVYYHLTDILFFALGGMLFIREVTKEWYAGVAGFIILLFSGDAAYWANQVFGFSVIEYVPWMLYLGLRYIREQTLGRAVVLVLMTGIGMNVYMPVYLIPFGITLLVFAAVYHRKALMGVDYRRLLRHLPVVLPLLAVLLLPTYLNYREITGDTYQLGRFRGPEQSTSYADRGEGGVITSRGDFEKLIPGMFSIIDGWKEAVPLIGLPAFAFMLYGFARFRREGLFWFSVLICMCLSYLAWLTPYHYFGFHAIPLYKLIRSYGFFSGFIALSAAVLSCLGIKMFLEKMSPGRTTALRHVIALALLLVGGYNLSVIRGFDYHNASGEMFSLDSRFKFSLQRPDGYNEVHLPLLPQTLFLSSPGECCVTFYNIAEKVDGPWFFDDWGGAHTLFVDKGYYHLSGVPGFDRLMKEKVRFFRYYTAGGGQGDINRYLDKSVLPVETDAGIRNRQRGLTAGMVDAKPPEPEARAVVLKVVGKTANRVTFEVEAEENVFMLYTDLYHEGFRAVVDKVEVPVVKGMGSFKALELSAGRHLVEFEFRPIYGYVLLVYLIIAVSFVLWLAGRGFYLSYRSLTVRIIND